MRCRPKIARTGDAGLNRSPASQNSPLTSTNAARSMAQGRGRLARTPYEVVHRESLGDADRFAVLAIVRGPVDFPFVGFWAMTPKDVGLSYTRQASLLIEALPIDELPTVVAGDFNASRARTIWRTSGGSRTADWSAPIHKDRGVPHSGREPEPTSYFLWNRSRPFHMDFIFVPDEWTIRSVVVGAFEEYAETKLSDYVPLVATLDPPLVRGLVSAGDPVGA